MITRIISTKEAVLEAVRKSSEPESLPAEQPREDQAQEEQRQAEQRQAERLLPSEEQCKLEGQLRRPERH